MINISCKDIVSAVNVNDANLLQVAIYDIHKPQQSCIMIYEKEPQPFFVALKPVADYCNRKKLPLPLIITREFIQYSTDSYPLEFIDIMTDYENLHVKEDLLAGLDIAAGDVRLQMERELKGKWLLTRLAGLEFASKPKHCATIAKGSAMSILPVLKGFFFLKQQTIPVDPLELIQQADALTAFDMQPLNRIYTKAVKEIDPAGIYAYIEMLSQLTRMMETWQL
ncbi:MAG: hypothetical protein FJ042_08220 [Candidatus Cloacimonetes bacterium]|nr:hypothetical protein [Candidatus Cloacimonadota bacterium]